MVFLTRKYVFAMEFFFSTNAQTLKLSINKRRDGTPMRDSPRDPALIRMQMEVPSSLEKPQ